MINAELISIGDEILNGQTINTNASWLGRELAKLGVNTKFISTIGDDKNEIINSLNLSISRADVILITGGLGPTKDDITKHTLAAYFNTELKENSTALRLLKQYYKNANRELNKLNQTQALLPEKCTPVINEIGTASGMWFDHNGKIIISMPGVPREMKKMMSDSILPKIEGVFNLDRIEYFFLKTVGVPESDLAIKLESWEKNLPKELKLAYLPSYGMVKLRLTKVKPISDVIIREVILDAKKIIGKYIYSYNEKETLQEAIGKLLLRYNSTIATAESCTGGHLSHLITTIPGSSQYYKGSVISYSNEIKQNELNIDSDLIKKYGAVSEEVVKQMALNIKRKFSTSYALATSGIAGPDGGSPEKPIGTIWIAIAYKETVKAKRLHLNQSREDNIHLTSIACLNLLRQTINEQLS